MSSRLIKQVIGVIVMAASLIFLVYYWRTHPEIVTQLRSVSPLATAAVIGLYLLMTLVLVGVYDTILALCGRRIPLGEHTLLTMYSSIINFFGPLQSGPGFRTVYLKKKHGVPVSAYLTGTLAYYALYGLISLIFVALALFGWVAAPLLLLAIIALYLVLRTLAARVGRLRRFAPVLRNPLLARLILLTFVQLLLVVLVYGIELRAVGAQVSVLEILGYAGAGSLALFVSLTPGALGFRESFQYFAQNIHHVDGPAIIAANVLDRAAYIVVLGILFVLALAFHARRTLLR